MLDTITHINEMTEDASITEPSLLNFCVTDGDSVIATRYISSRHDEAASLVRLLKSNNSLRELTNPRTVVLVWYHLQ